jgi:hypothetical protein
MMLNEADAEAARIENQRLFVFTGATGRKHDSAVNGAPESIG